PPFCNPMTLTDSGADAATGARALDLVVVHSPVGGGHKSAALAIAEAARARGLTVDVVDTFEHAPRVLGQAYVTAHLAWTGALPELYGAAYFRANHRDGALEPVRRAADHVAWAGLVKRVVALAPRAVVATHHLPLVVLGRARRKGRLACPLLGVVTDYGAHAVWAEKGLDALCVPGDRAFRDALAHRFPEALLHTTGIPVGRAFESAPPVRDPARGETLRVLVTSGGFGVGPIRDIVGSFAGIDGVELTVVCGRAPGLERRVARLAAEAGVRARVLGFERDMAARMAEAHVVVGKAGGLTVSEAMTSGRPMIIAGAVPGNEGINAGLVARAGAGHVADPADVGSVVEAMRVHRLFGAMGRNARAMVLTHAADRVLDVAEAAVRRHRAPAAA
ncbi:MAG TPA: glycosyltransferase, partial [Polyangiaceae bacterium]|nr:glycosyltransferase [Polyangiaceae bacterium]